MATAPEDRLTAWLRERVAGRGLDLIGDDAAFLDSDRIAVTVDQQVEGVHFRPGLTPESIGRRLVAVNLSDVAAVGGEPTFGFLALTFPGGYPVRRLLSAVEKCLADRGARLAGGDLSSGEQLNASLTLLAKRVPHGRWLRRSSALAGDLLWVGGTLGSSALGQNLLAAGARYRGRRLRLPADLTTTASETRCAERAVERHLRPPVQLELGAWLARRRRAAAIDVSDGLLLDLARLCRASGVGAVVEVDRIPTVDSFAATSRTAGYSPTDLMLSGGEDYVLLFTLPSSIQPPQEFGATLIGSIRPRPGIEVLGADPPRRNGWDHLARAKS